MKLPVIFENFSPRADKSVSLRFGSMLEVPDTFYTELASERGLQGWINFSPEKNVPVPTERLPETGKMTNSQRLRWKIKKLHIQRGGSEESWETFYTKAMKEFEKQIDSKLDI